MSAAGAPVAGPAKESAGSRGALCIGASGRAGRKAAAAALQAAFQSMTPAGAHLGSHQIHTGVSQRRRHVICVCVRVEAEQSVAVIHSQSLQE
eukprot:IDg14727t1